MPAGIRNLLIISTVVTLLLPLPQACAQLEILSKESYVRSHWGTKEGLPSNESRAIIQTRDGFIWIGTAFGPARFDGFRFETFSDKLPAHVRSSEVSCFLEDQDGSVWIGFQTRGILRYAGGEFTVPRSCTSLKHSGVSDLLRDSLGTIYACTSEGLYCIQGDSGYYRRPLPDHTVKGFITQGNVLFLYAAQIVRIAPGHSPQVVSTMYRNTSITGVFVESPTTLLVASVDNIRRFRIAAGDTLIPLQTYHTELASAFLPEDGGRFLMGVRGRGILRYARGEFSPVNGLTVPKGPAEQIHSLLRDNEGGIWATTNAGVFRFAQSFFKTFGEASGLPNEYTWLMHLSRDGTLWVGAGRGGTFRIRDGASRLLSKKDGLPENNITEMFEASDGSMWFGGYNGGVARLRNGVWQRLDKLPGFRGGKVYSINEDSGKKIWIGTRSGLNTFEGNRFVSHPLHSPASEGSVRAIVPGTNKEIWYAAGGFTRRLRNDSVQVFRTENEQAIYGVFCLYVDSSRVWYGTYGGGLYLIRNDSATSLRSISSAFGPRVISIIEDRFGYLWLNAERELQRVRKADILAALDNPGQAVHVDIYNYLDGLENIEFNFSSSHSAQMIPDGRILYASTSGIVVVDPAVANRPTAPPPVTIERIVADDVPVPLQNAVLPPGTRRVVIEYSALRFQAPGRVLFRYRLSGVDHDWMEAGGLERSVTYTNPGYGNFSFIVTASSDGGPWNTRVAGTTFSVAPHLYERWSVRLGAAVTVLLLLVAGHRLRVRRMKERNRLLEEEVTLRRKIEKQLTGSLEEKTVLLKEIHHRVKNNMQVISSLMSLQLGSSGEPMIQEALKESQARIRSMALVHETLYQSDNFAAVSFKNYLEQLVRQVCHANQKPNVTVSVDGTPLTLPIDQAIPAGLLMNELLTNAMKHAFPDDTPGSITVHAGQENDRLVVLCVSDTGKGLPPDFDVAKSTTLGLRLVTSLVVQLGGTLDVKSESGTTFTVQFPSEA